MADVDHDTLARWFGIYADAPGHISITAFKDGRHQSHHYTTDPAGIAQAMVDAQRLSDDGHDVYMRTTTVDADQLGDGRRGGADETVAVIGIGTDLDHGQGHHKRNDLPPTPADALSLIDGMPPPTIVVNSGGGFYAWWLFDQPSTDLDLCAPLLRRWNAHIIDRAAGRGWHVDQVGDLPRILRPVGTVSYKGGQPTPVVVHDHTGLRYQPDTLVRWLDDHAPEPQRHQPTLPPDRPHTGDDLAGRIRRQWTVEQELETRGIHVPPSGTIRCPFPSHDDHTPSFKVYDDPDDGWACYGSSCPSSGGGSVIDLVMWLDSCDVRQAIDLCARRIGAPPPSTLTTPTLVAPPEQLAQAVTTVPQDGVDVDPALAALDPTNPLDAAVLNEYVRLVARDRARQLLTAQNAPEPPPTIRLTDLLAQPDPPVTYRIVNLWPAGGRVMLAAQFKAGKSTLVGNVVRSLVDGAPFLGQHPVEPLDRRVFVIDDELDVNTIRRWYREQDIRNTDQVELLPLRGKTSTFNIIDPHVRAMWADRIRAADAQVVIFDCLRPVLDALGLSEHTEAGQLLTAFDELLADAGVDEALVVHHMGHDSERSRGDSRLRDWPDAEWKIVRVLEDDENDNPDAPRFFSAYGRDVDEKEQQLVLDGRTLTLSGQDRRTQRRMQEVLNVVARLQQLGGEASFNQLKTALGCGVPKAKRLVSQAITEGYVEVEETPTQLLIHRLTPKGESA